MHMHIKPQWEWVVECRVVPNRVEGSADSLAEAQQKAHTSFLCHPKGTYPKDTRAEVIGPKGGVMELVPSFRRGRAGGYRWIRSRGSNLVIQ